jgi:hypothetical protein
MSLSHGMGKVNHIITTKKKKKTMNKAWYSITALQHKTRLSNG